MFHFQNNRLDFYSQKLTSLQHANMVYCLSERHQTSPYGLTIPIICHSLITQNMSRFLKIIVVIAIFCFLAWGMFGLNKQNNFLKTKLRDLDASAQNLQKENQSLQEQIKYFSFPENLLKEARTLFNYRQPGEKMFIVVPR